MKTLNKKKNGLINKTFEFDLQRFAYRVVENPHTINPLLANTSSKADIIVDTVYPYDFSAVLTAVNIDGIPHMYASVNDGSLTNYNGNKFKSISINTEDTEKSGQIKIENDDLGYDMFFITIIGNDPDNYPSANPTDQNTIKDCPLKSYYIDLSLLGNGFVEIEKGVYGLLNSTYDNITETNFFPIFRDGIIYVTVEKHNIKYGPDPVNGLVDLTNWCKKYHSSSLYLDDNSVMKAADNHYLSIYEIYETTKLAYTFEKYLNSIKPSNMENCFKTCSDITTLDISNMDTSNVVSFSHCFDMDPDNNKQDDGTLTTIIGIEDIDTSSCTDMSYMFKKFKSSKTLDLSKWNTSKVQNVQYMFNEAELPYGIDISLDIEDASYMFYNPGVISDHLNIKTTNKLTNTHSMFFGLASCKVDTLDLNGINMENVVDAYGMIGGGDANFGTNSSIRILDASKWNTPKVQNFENLCTTIGFNTIPQITILLSLDLSSCTNAKDLLYLDNRLDKVNSSIRLKNVPSLEKWQLIDSTIKDLYDYFIYSTAESFESLKDFVIIENYI